MHRYYTSQYHAPEEAKGDPYSEKADIYALGNVIRFLILGVRPFQAISSPDEVFEKIADGESIYLPEKYETSEDPMYVALVDMMHRCHNLDPEKRPNAKDVVRYFDDVLFIFKDSTAWD